MKAGSVYYHFDSKEHLLEEILRQGMDVMVEAFEGVSTDADENRDPDLVAAHVRAHLAALFEFGPYTAAHVITFPMAPTAVRSAIVPVRDGYESMWADLLDRLAGAGVIAGDVDLSFARLLLFGAMNSTIEWFDPERSSIDDLAEVIARQFWCGVAANPGACP